VALSIYSQIKADESSARQGYLIFMESAGLLSQRPNKRETRASNMPPPRNMQSRDDGWNSARDLVTVSLEFQVKPLSARVRIQAGGGGSCVSPRGKIQRLIAPSQQIYSFPLPFSSPRQSFFPPFEKTSPAAREVSGILQASAADRETDRIQSRILTGGG